MAESTYKEALHVCWHFHVLDFLLGSDVRADVAIFGKADNWLDVIIWTKAANFDHEGTGRVEMPVDQVFLELVTRPERMKCGVALFLQDDECHARNLYT